MNPIELLLEWRTDKVLRDFDISVKKFGSMTLHKEREENWIILKKKLISRGYIINNDYTAINCYIIIKNIIWKNIIKYKIMTNQCYGYMLYNNHQYALICNGHPNISRWILLNTYIIESRNNIHILQDIIIKFLILLDNIITQHLIPDLSHITKFYMVNSILTI